MVRTAWVTLLLVLACATTAAAADGAHVESFSGEVLIDSRGSAVVVMIDTFKDGRDGLVDQWFIFQTSAPGVPVSEHFQSAQIVHAAGNLRVLSADRRTLYDFVVTGYARGAAVPSGVQVTRVEGFGLSHNVGETEIQIPKIRRNSAVTAFDCIGCEVLYPCDDCGGAGGSSCESGGQGSTSCSATFGSKSCSVTCGGNYYACCNITASSVSCKCVSG